MKALQSDDVYDEIHIKMSKNQRRMRNKRKKEKEKTQPNPLERTIR